MNLFLVITHNIILSLSNFLSKTLFNKDDENSEDSENSEEIAYVTLPYILVVSEKFINIIKDFNVKLTYCSLNN